MVGIDAEHALAGLGERLRSAREHRTLDEVAKYMGCNKVSVSRYEGNKQIPDAAYLLKYAALVDRSAAWLITGVEVDETALSIREQHYIHLAKTASSVLEKKLQENKRRLNWESAGKVYSMLFKHAIILTHEGSIVCGVDAVDSIDLINKLEDYLEDLFSIVSSDIYVQSVDACE